MDAAVTIGLLMFSPEFMPGITLSALPACAVSAASLPARGHPYGSATAGGRPIQGISVPHISGGPRRPHYPSLSGVRWAGTRGVPAEGARGRAPQGTAGGRPAGVERP